MPNASIGGLASGLDTASIISQLMQLEAIPQTRLQSRVSTEERQVNSMTTLNSKLAALATRAKELARAFGSTDTTPSVWNALKATSSNTLVAVSSAVNVTPLSFTLTVDQTAATHQLGFLNQAALTDVVTSGSTSVRIDRLDGTTQDVDTGDGTFQGLVDAINNPDNATGLHATAVRVGTDQYRLLVESTKTGVTQDVTLANLDGSDLLGGANVRSGRDAIVSLGAGITATSESNTFSDLVPGLTVTLSSGAAAGTITDVSVKRDSSGVTAKVKAFIDSINATLADIDSLSSYNATTKAAGILAGDAATRNLRSELLNSIYPADGSSPATLGIQVDRTGRLTFDETTFSQAYDADPAGVQEKFVSGATDGFAARMSTLAHNASNSVDGTFTLAITGRNDGIKRLKDSIEQWDTRLELRRTALTRQFTGLEVALSQMNSQSNWLAGQIGSLPKSSGS